MNFAIRRAEAVPLVGLVNVDRRRQRLRAVGQDGRSRRLVRDEGPHLLRVPRHQHEPVDRAAAAGEDVHRPAAERRDQPVQIVRVLLGLGLLRSSVRWLRPTPRGS